MENINYIILNYFGNWSDFIQTFSTIAAFITVIIAYKQLKSENQKRDIEVNNIKDQTFELKRIFELQSTIRGNQIKPRIYANGSSSSPDGYTYYYINKGETAHNLSMEVIECPEQLSLEKFKEIELLEKNKTFEVKLHKRDSAYGFDKLKGLRVKFQFVCYDADYNYHLLPSEIIDGKHILGIEISHSRGLRELEE